MLDSKVANLVRASVFFGVPHRGADIAYWANFPATLLKTASLGFGGNTGYLEALKSNSHVWHDISKQFVKRAISLKIRTFYETEKVGNILVRMRQANYPNK